MTVPSKFKQQKEIVIIANARNIFSVEINIFQKDFLLLFVTQKFSSKILRVHAHSAIPEPREMGFAWGICEVGRSEWWKHKHFPRKRSMDYSGLNILKFRISGEKRLACRWTLYPQRPPRWKINQVIKIVFAVYSMICHVGPVNFGEERVYESLVPCAIQSWAALLFTQITRLVTEACYTTLTTSSLIGEPNTNRIAKLQRLKANKRKTEELFQIGMWRGRQKRVEYGLQDCEESLQT